MAAGAFPAQGWASEPAPLHFQAGEHLFGFTANQVTLAAAGDLVQVEFLDTPGALPQQAGQPGVRYAELWPGIQAVYEPGSEGVARSSYQLAPGADPGAIRLRYSAPVEIQPDGSLRLLLLNGGLSEDAPRAWQTILGERVEVAAAFVVSDTGGGQVVGFSLAPYDPTYALTITPGVLHGE
jgi:hypothetical protein